MKPCETMAFDFLFGTTGIIGKATGFSKKAEKQLKQCFGNSMLKDRAKICSWYWVHFCSGFGRLCNSKEAEVNDRNQMTSAEMTYFILEKTHEDNTQSYYELWT